MDIISISSLNIIRCYLTSFIRKKKNTNGYLYKTFKHYNTKPKKQINKKRTLLHAQSVCDESSIYIVIYIHEALLRPQKLRKILNWLTLTFFFFHFFSWICGYTIKILFEFLQLNVRNHEKKKVSDS